MSTYEGVQHEADGHERHRRERPLPRRGVRSGGLPGQQRQGGQGENAVDARGARQRARGRAEPPPFRPKSVEGGHREEQEQRLGIDDAVEERERKRAGEDHRPFGSRARQVGAAEAVEHHHREDVRHPRDDDAGEIQILPAAAERQAHVSHHERVHREEGQVTAPALDELVAVPRNAKVPARVVPGEGVPQQVRAVEHGELLPLCQRKHDVHDERQEGREHPDRDRERHDAERGAPGRAHGAAGTPRSQPYGGLTDSRTRKALDFSHRTRVIVARLRP